MSKDREKKRRISEALYKQFIFEAAVELSKENTEETRNRLLDLVNKYEISKTEFEKEEAADV